MARITDVDVADVCCPTSRELDGSDAMNRALDHTAAYVIPRTEDPDGVVGLARTFITGHGNGAAACEAELPAHDCPTSPDDAGSLWTAGRSYRFHREETHR
ncbi:hypothetical protein [Streptomyces sp. NPDC048496]|uniref:hypothetical protein n=1 Tax=Streptomyces sp. NPDC048496 TaxID=3365558 RepID=UPI0037190C0B